MRTIRLTIATAVMLLMSVSAQAMSIMWTFQNTMFDDGTSLTGSFDYNTSSIGPGGYSNVSVQTQAGSGFVDTLYDSVTFFSGGIGFTSTSGEQALGILFGDWIGWGGDPGSSVNVIGGEIGPKTLVGISVINFFGHNMVIPEYETPTRHIISGTLTHDGGPTALVESGTLVTFVIGLATILLMRRRAII